MGILDEAIREHLELKRQHGAPDSEVESLESEAFGPADRPDAVDAPDAPSSGYSEDETRIISPGSAVTAPAGEGDQLDKVFEAERQKDASTDPEVAAIQRAVPDLDEQPTQVAEIPPPPPPAAPPEPHAEAAPDQTETAADPVAEAPGITPDAIEEEPVGDAGDALEAERQTLSGYPTEHYDVDAAIAEEDEIDVLSESSLSDELDRALDGPSDGPLDESDSEEVEAEHEFEPETAAAPEPEPVPESAPEPTPESAPEPEPVPESAPEPTPELATGEVVEEEQHDLADADFFDQNDPLEGTPDFLEETPEHDRLWFEQKEPKDFDFGD